MKESSMQNSAEFDVAIIGAGAIGLATAQALAEKGQKTVVLERHRKFGQETSSRNSEVIHSGIYYPASSFKTKWCLEGQRLLYTFATQWGVPFRKTGKLVVAATPSEESALDKLYTHARELGVRVERRTGAQIVQSEPAVRVHSALFFPESGIIDSHQYMERLLAGFEGQEGVLAYGHTVLAAESTSFGWNLTCDVQGERMHVGATHVVNAGGLHAAKLSNQALHTSRYEHRFCRGRYLNATGSLAGAFRSLIYPIPPKDGLGIHVTLDLNGGTRFGPDVDWWPDANDQAGLYDSDWEKLRPEFLNAIQRYCPSATESHLTGGFVGVRPKLFIDGKPSPDFLIENHDGWIHQLGMESPGLTASLAIAAATCNLIK